MAKQISLDTWQVNRLAELLRKGSKVSGQTNRPVILYRQTMEEEGDICQEVVCSLTRGYAVEQVITSGGGIVPVINKQHVYPLEDYPGVVLRKSRGRALEIIDLLEKEVE